MTKGELQYKLSILADKYACDNAKFAIGTRFEGADGDELEIKKVVGSLCFTGGQPDVTIGYICLRISDSQYFNLPESLIETFSRHE